MIYYVKGILTEKSYDYVVIEAAGLGYCVFVPSIVIDELPEKGNDVILYTHHHIREDAQTLYGFKTLKDKYQQAYNQYVPYYTNSSAGSEMNYANRDELMRKLNYLIHMMEEGKDEKTENVTEELVLYLFLGVFVIFVVDSFARAGKYTR